MPNILSGSSNLTTFDPYASLKGRSAYAHLRGERTGEKQEKAVSLGKATTRQDSGSAVCSEPVPSANSAAASESGAQQVKRVSVITLIYLFPHLYIH